MQSATSPKKRAGNSKSEGPARPVVRKKLRPITIVLLVLIALASIGTMVVVLLGYWPPKSSSEGLTVQPTSEALAREGLIVEKNGAIKPDPNYPGQVFVPVKVTNKVIRAAKLTGTPTPGAAAPTPGPAHVLNATIRVLLYRMENGQRKDVGGADGNVIDLKYGESKEIDIVVPGVDDPNGLDYLPVVVSIWTDKDAHVIHTEASSMPHTP